MEPALFPVWKRCVDVGCSLLGLPVLAVVLLLTMFVVRIYSPGSVLFRQVRVGYRGREFTIYKIRTMMNAADDSGHREHLAQLIGSQLPMEKLDTRSDERLIPGGLFIRASGLDELPQLINVLRGEMSLVGPRPCLPFEFARYPIESLERFCGRPGLTGLWQVSGKNRTTFREMLRLDCLYVRALSLPRDLAIMLRTFPVLARQVAEVQRQPQHSPGLKPRTTPISGRSIHVTDPGKPWPKGIAAN